MDIRYPAMTEPKDESGFTVSFPNLDEAVTQGDTMKEALFNAADVLT
jgi:antitoxin HicB